MWVPLICIGYVVAMLVRPLCYCGVEKWSHKELLPELVMGRLQKPYPLVLDKCNGTSCLAAPVLKAHVHNAQLLKRLTDYKSDLLNSMPTDWKRVTGLQMSKIPKSPRYAELQEAKLMPIMTPETSAKLVQIGPSSASA